MSNAVTSPESRLTSGALVSDSRLATRDSAHGRREYVRLSVRDAVVIALPEAIEFVANAIESAGSLYARAASWPGARPLDGRGTTWCIDVPGGAWAVRHCRRGGAMAGVLVDRYVRVGRPRPFRELRAAVDARARGIAMPRVVAAVVHSRGPIYRADVATELVPDGLDLAAVVFGRDRRDPPARIAAWRAAGRLVRDAAAAGVYHADLNLKNIVVTGPRDGPEGWLVDFDRGRVRRRPSRRDLVRMADRVRRSTRKFERLTGESADAAALHAFDQALDGG